MRARDGWLDIEGDGRGMRRRETYHVVEVEPIDLVHVLVELPSTHLFGPVPLLVVHRPRSINVRIHLVDVHADVLVILVLLFLLFLLLFGRCRIDVCGDDVRDVDVVVPCRLLVISGPVYVDRVKLCHLPVVRRRVPVTLEIERLKRYVPAIT